MIKLKITFWSGGGFKIFFFFDTVAGWWQKMLVWSSDYKSLYFCIDMSVWTVKANSNFTNLFLFTILLFLSFCLMKLEFPVSLCIKKMSKPFLLSDVSLGERSNDNYGYSKWQDNLRQEPNFFSPGRTASCGLQPSPFSHQET